MFIFGLLLSAMSAFAIWELGREADFEFAVRRTLYGLLAILLMFGIIWINLLYWAWALGGSS